MIQCLFRIVTQQWRWDGSFRMLRWKSFDHLAVIKNDNTECKVRECSRHDKHAGAPYVVWHFVLTTQQHLPFVSWWLFIPEMNTSPVVFRKLATLLSLPGFYAMVATPADTDSTVILRSGHAIGWSPVTWPNLGSISGWNLGCHVRLVCRPSAVGNKHACSVHTWSNMEVARLWQDHFHPLLFLVNELWIMMSKDNAAFSQCQNSSQCTC